MSAAELDDFLTTERTCRVASLDAGGGPSVTPLWFVWDGTALWLNSLTKSQRWTNLQRDGRIAIVIDAGEAFFELRGVEISGLVEVVGDVPRTAGPNDALAEPERLFGQKYAGGAFTPDGRHAWLRIVPDKISSWDFRKNPALRPPPAT